MSGKTEYTIDSLKREVASRVSEKRFNHCLGVAASMDKVLRHYSSPLADDSFCGMPVSDFCGIGHDIAREVPLDQVLSVCAARGIALTPTQIATPVFAHGVLASSMLEEMYPGVPSSWLRAIDIHTLGDEDMDDVALALFIADFIEPGRTYLTDADRERFLSEPTMRGCALAILRGIIEHQLGKGNPPPEESVRMLAWLEREKS